MQFYVQWLCSKQTRQLKGIFHMVRFALRVVLTALVLTYILPMIGGIHFTGTFWPEGIIYGVLFALCGWILAALVALFTVGTLGIGLIFLILGFWLLPAIQLELMAWLFPAHFAIQSFGSAVLAGLVLMVVNTVTHTHSSSSN
jgi:uncharacterized membrane protein YvlD (DUF360 family)